ALLGLVEPEVLDPPPAVAADVEAGLDDRAGDGRVPLEGERAGEDGHAHFALGEQAQQAPEADPAPVLVHGLHGQVADALRRAPARGLGEADPGPVVTAPDGVLGTLLVVDSDLDRAPRPPGPARARSR